MGSDSPDRVRQSFDWQEVSPCVAVVETIERYEQTQPGPSSGLENPLGSYFVVDALDDLVPADLRLTISFDIEDYTVTISDNAVSVTAAGADHHVR